MEGHYTADDYLLEFESEDGEGFSESPAGEPSIWTVKSYSQHIKVEAGELPCEGADCKPSR